MSNTQPIEEQPEAGQPCATCAGIELIADPDEHWQYRNGEPMAPDAAAFLEYLRGVEQRLVAAEARVAELESQLAAQGWRPVTEDWPPYNERVIIGHGGGYGGGWCVFARRVRTDDRDGDDWLMDDDTTLAFESAVVAMRRPLPPAPQETE